MASGRLANGAGGFCRLAVRDALAASEWTTEGMPSFLVLLLICGAVGLFLTMPGGRAKLSRVGYVLLAAAGGTLVAVAVRLASGQATLGWFIVGALVALFAAVRVITHKRPVYSALYFVLLVVAIACLLVQMEAGFLAAALVIIYAGAILVTYLFVIMLAQQGRLAAYDSKSREPFWGCLAGFALLAVIGAQAFANRPGPKTDATIASAAGTVEAVGTLLLTDYVVGIQAAGLLLLVAMVGAIAIARRRPPSAAGSGEGD